MKKLFPHRFIVLFIVVITVFSTVFLTSCGEQSSDETFLAMDTVMEIRIYGGDDDLLDRCGKIIKSVEDKFSATKTGSLVYRLNSGETLDDAELISLITKCNEISSSTSGAFDITVYPLVKSYGFIDKNFRLPEASELNSLLNYVGYDKIIISNGKVSLNYRTEIDLGGIAKGYCSDLLKEYLVSNGIKSGVINLGGNVMTIGKKQNKNWRVAIADPYGNGYIGILDISDKAVVTSGLYERFFEKDGVKYGHIIDPSSGKPVSNGFLSVTVVGESGTECDALSTALFVMGPEKAEQYVLDNHLEVIFLTDDNVVHITKNLNEILELTGDYKTAVKAVIDG